MSIPNESRPARIEQALEAKRFSARLRKDRYRAGKKRVEYYPSRIALKQIEGRPHGEPISAVINRLIESAEAAQGDIGSMISDLIEAERPLNSEGGWDGRPQEALDALRELAAGREISLSEAIAQMLEVTRKALSEEGLEVTKCR
jgi:hypothetical protein